MDSSAFSRVKSLLKYSRPAQWTAILCGMATAVLYALLVLLLALFVDLLVTRGRIPNFAQLSVPEQKAVLSDWAALSPEERVRALQHVGFGEFEGVQRADAPAAAESPGRWQLYQDFLGTDGESPPVPGAASPDALRDWAAKRGYWGDPYMI